MKDIIFKNINMIVENIEKGINTNTLSSIKPRLRKNLKLITKKIEFANSKTWNRVLSSEKLIEFVNETTYPMDLVETIFLSETEEKEKEFVISSPHVVSVYEALKKENKRREESYNYYARSFKKRIPNFLIDLLLYFDKYEFEEKKLKKLIKILSELRENYNNDFESLKEKRFDYMHHHTYSYTKYIKNMKSHFENHFENANFFEEVKTLMNKKEEEYFNTIIASCISKSLKKSSDGEELKKTIISLLGLKNDKVSKWIYQLCSSSKNLILENEWKRLLNNASNEGENVFEVIYGKNSLQSNVLSELNCSDKMNFIKNNLKKKGFLRLIGQNVQTFNNFNLRSVLFHSTFSKLINLNTLNTNNLESLRKMNDVTKLEGLNEEIPLTFNEFEYLYSANETNRKVFYGLVDSTKVDERLRMCRELPERHIMNLGIEKELYVEKIISILKRKSLKKTLKERGLSLKGAKTQHYLALLTNPGKFEKYFKDITTGNDIEFILNNQNILEVAQNLEEAKIFFLEKDKYCKFLFKKLGVSRGFINENITNVIKYVEAGLAEVFYKIHHAGRQSEEQLRNLSLITKAELVGKLNEVKFNDNDFELEIGMPISEKTKKEWKTNEIVKDEFYICESSSYETTIRIGQDPVSTCLHWNNGMYSRCLLSNFDTNKKVLLAKDKKGKTIARAILRLTKGSDTHVTTLKKRRLEFKDVTGGEEKQEVKTKKAREELVLFLERTYSGLDREQAKVVKRLFTEFAKEKASKLGAKIIMSSEYKEQVKEELEEKTYFIFVSYSKNGYQYLDSLTGQASESNEGKYMKGYVLLEKEVSKEVPKEREKQLIS